MAAALIHLDTHVLVWLFAGRKDLLSPRAVEVLETADLFASPITRLELTYLAEIGRLAERADAILADLRQRVGLRIAEDGLAEVVRTAVRQTWTRDPFDRLIVGHAALRESALLTRDRTIAKHYGRAVW